MIPSDFIPKKPFGDFKWKWASLQCTEGLNDPVVLLGVLSRMRKLEKRGVGLKYSSEEFSREMSDLSKDIKDSLNINLATRTGERNLIRNSGQYWRAVGLIPSDNDHSGIIRLTDFGRKVADREISQTEFAAMTIQSLTLPNVNIQPKEECDRWLSHGICFQPLLLLLRILLRLYEYDSSSAYITNQELLDIIIPLSGCAAKVEDYFSFILQFRNGQLSLIGWPDCCPMDNDKRFAREFFLFLANYGYVFISGESRSSEVYSLNTVILDEIKDIAKNVGLTTQTVNTSLSGVTSEIERKRVSYSVSRPNQASFRRAVLNACERCVITNVTMPEVLEAAHIKPYKYNGADSVANGFAMRVDIHTLFDTGHLRISPEGEVVLSGKARLDYGATIPPRILIPPFTDVENIRWRWDNFNGI